LDYADLDDAANDLSPEQINDLLAELNEAMKKAALDLDFEQAAKLRDRIFELEHLL
jgi:excinuclease ABC subunit B